MDWFPDKLDAFTLTSGIISLAGTIVSIWTLCVAKSVNDRFKEFRDRLVRRVRLTELANQIRQFQRVLRRGSSNFNRENVERVGHRLIPVLTALESRSSGDILQQAGNCRVALESMLQERDEQLCRGKLGAVIGQMERLSEQTSIWVRDDQLEAEHDQ